jgi:hypothetical protein
MLHCKLYRADGSSGDAPSLRLCGRNQLNSRTLVAAVRNLAAVHGCENCAMGQRMPAPQTRASTRCPHKHVVESHELYYALSWRRDVLATASNT